MSSTVFAYDGSTHGDWVGRYAIRLAHSGGNTLEIFHVDEGARDAKDTDRRLEHLCEVAEATGVAVDVRHVPLGGGDVASTLDKAIAEETDSLVVTGLRAHESGRGLLRGTVSEHLLRSRRHDVLAFRVVSPGLLGHAHHVLYTLSQNPHSAERAGRFLRAMGPELTRISLLTVFPPRFGQWARPTSADLELLRARAMAWLRTAESDLRTALAPFELPFESHASVSTDWPDEVIRHAGRVRADLLLLGTTERTAVSRTLFGTKLEQVLHDTVCDVAIFQRAARRES